MKEPMRPWPHPMEYEYEARVDRVYIYKYKDDLDPEGVLEKDEDDEDGEDSSLPQKDISKVNLAWLLKQIPDGLSPKDIKIEFGYNYNCMAMEDHYVNFYYEKKIPARKAEFREAKSQYEIALKQYETDLLAYKAYCKAKEIKEAEEKLARLKGEIGEKI